MSDSTEKIKAISECINKSINEHLDILRYLSDHNDYGVNKDTIIFIKSEVSNLNKTLDKMVELICKKDMYDIF